MPCLIDTSKLEWEYVNEEQEKCLREPWRIGPKNASKEENKEYNRTYKKEYNKIMQSKGKTICECGCEISFSCLNEHKKTNKHKDFLDKIQSKNKAR
jgi:hypothetical protein